MEQHNDQRTEELGPLLKRLRRDTSLRDVRGMTGISNSYLSQIERGDRRPGPSVLKRLASLYGVDVQDLLKRAGYLDDPEDVPPRDDEPQEVERAYQYVLADPQFRVGTRPDGPLSIKAKRFIVEMYERFTGKRLLE
jgi:transcriptional regulator with XRE-family HTH domain